MGYARSIQAVQRLHQSGVPPVQHMVVRQTAAVDASGRKAAYVSRAHAIVNLFARPGLLAARDGGLQVDDPDLRARPLQRSERVAPDVREVHRPCDRTIEALRQPHVIAGVTDVRFEQHGVGGVRQNLIHTPARHDITTQEHPYGVGLVSV
jgi:hypothetical protein